MYDDLYPDPSVGCVRQQTFILRHLYLSSPLLCVAVFCFVSRLFNILLAAARAAGSQQSGRGRSQTHRKYTYIGEGSHSIF